MFGPGPRNRITDIPGLRVGHAEDDGVASGVTVVLCAGHWRAGVDVRGGGPGTRETDVLAPENLIGRAHAIVLAGGSVFGLSAADGVAAALSQAGVGLVLRPGSPAIPIVPAAVLHDLGNGGDKHWGLEPPYRSLGMRALAAAGPECALGRVGAGRGARAGLVAGGIGSASIDLGDDIIVGALAAVNCIGSVFMPDGVTYWAAPFALDGELGGDSAGQTAGSTQPVTLPRDVGNPVPDDSRLAQLGRLQPGANTTLVVVACTADLSTAECKRVAMMAQDGIARAIRPAHTPFDGDTIFCLASSAVGLASGPDVEAAARTRPAALARIGSAAADCTARAIARAVHCSR